MCGRALALVGCGEQALIEEQPHENDADKVDAQSPPGLRITTGAKPMKSGKDIDAECQNMQASPPGIANARAQPGADADGEPEVQSHNAQGHPE